jgi:hypothetical protein
MTEDKSGEGRTARLRRLAEERSRESATEIARTVAEQDYQGLVHELQVRQIEFEMQNEELRIAQGQLGESSAKYSDLYDFAPVAGTSIEVIGVTVDELVTVLLDSPAPFHRCIVFAAPRGAVAFGAMIEGFLCRRHIGLFSLPDLQSRLLDRAGKRKGQRPGHSRLESGIHGIQTG